MDGVLDTVAGGSFGPSVSALRAGGVLSLVGAVGGSEVIFDAWKLIHPVTLTGYSTESLDGPTLRRAIAALSVWLAKKTLHPPEHRTIPLSDAARAHTDLERGGLNGRLLLTPASSDVPG